MSTTKCMCLFAITSIMAVCGAGCGGGGDAAAPVVPAVSFVSPLASAFDVPLNTKLAVTFNQAMDPASIGDATFTLALEGDVVTPVAGTVYAADVNALFTPLAVLVADSVYTATISTGAKNPAGAALAADYVWSFSTGATLDETAPLISFVDPLPDAVAVPVNKLIRVTFSEAMTALTLTGGTTFTLADELSNDVPGEVTYAGTVATFTPTDALASSAVYTATITVAAQDLAGNPLASEYSWSFTTGASVLLLEPVPLGLAARFAALSGAGLTNVPTSTFGGDVGVSPSALSTIDLIAADVPAPYAIYGPETLTNTAKGDLTIAMNNAAGRTPIPVGDYLDPGAGNLSGLTLGPGVYKFTSTAVATGNFTLTGTADDVWIFQIGTSLDVSNDVQVILGDAAKAKNIFWQVGTAATLGTGVVFKGTLMSDAAITMMTGANLEGRALVFSANIVLQQATITLPLP